MHRFLLLENHASGLEIADLGDHGTLHDGATLVVLDEAHPARFLERDLLGETLLLKVANGVIVGIRQKMHDIRRRFDIILVNSISNAAHVYRSSNTHFEMRHQMCAVPLDLLVRGDGAEDDLGELSALERLIGDTTAPANIGSTPATFGFHSG